MYFVCHKNYFQSNIDIAPLKVNVLAIVCPDCSTYTLSALNRYDLNFLKRHQYLVAKGAKKSFDSFLCLQGKLHAQY